jgi:enoyl-[acyl-carrier-protein] reductase (NADH)
MVAAGVGGSVVNISSHGAVRAHRNRIAYDAVKGAMDAFTRAVALDLAPWGIRVNTVRPGAIAVDRGPGDPPDPRAADADQIPLGRMGTPADIAAAVAFLASDQAGYITGQGVTVDGGLGAQARPPGQEPHWSPDLSAIRARLAASPSPVDKSPIDTSPIDESPADGSPADGSPAEESRP